MLIVHFNNKNLNKYIVENYNDIINIIDDNKEKFTDSEYRDVLSKLAMA